MSFHRARLLFVSVKLLWDNMYCEWCYTNKSEWNWIVRTSGKVFKGSGSQFSLVFLRNLNCFQIWPFFLSLVRTHRMHVLALFFIQGIFSCVLSKGRFTHSPLLPGWGFSSFQNPLPSPISALGGNVDWKPRNMEPRLGRKSLTIYITLKVYVKVGQAVFGYMLDALSVCHLL